MPPAGLAGCAAKAGPVVGCRLDGALAGSRLRRAEIGSLVLANRTPERAARLAATLTRTACRPGPSASTRYRPSSRGRRASSLHRRVGTVSDGGHGRAAWHTVMSGRW